MEKIPKLNKCRAFFKAVGLEKNPKLMNIGPMFILDYRVCFDTSEETSCLFFQNSRVIS